LAIQGEKPPENGNPKPDTCNKKGAGKKTLDEKSLVEMII
jgi:hypothetical protein